MSEKRKMVKIGTHSGSFHCDEALGCYLLRQTAMFRDAEIVRSRDPEVWKDMDVLIDVGGVYDPAAHRYDHHQRDFADVFGHGFTTKLSSAGLVYKHFGKEIVAGMMQQPPDAADVQTVWLQVYRTFVEAVDAVDNGINQYDTDAPPRYTVTTALPARVGALNPDWNVPHDAADLDARFADAVALTGAEFADAVRRAAHVWLPARAIVEDMLKQAPTVHPSGAIGRLPRVCPWRSHLDDLEAQLGVPGRTKFVLYEDERERKWRVQAINEPGSFALRLALPEPWRGLRGDALSAASGIPGCVFVHAAGFIGGNDTADGALAMAAAALEA